MFSLLVNLSPSDKDSWAVTLAGCCVWSSRPSSTGFGANCPRAVREDELADSSVVVAVLDTVLRVSCKEIPVGRPLQA